MSDHASIHEEELASNRRHSIDLTLELERQLDNESLPPNSPRNPRPQSLDTNVLASIVTQLRMSLDEVTSERNSLAEELSSLRSHEVGSKEALHTVTEKCLRLETALTAAQELHKEDEDAIAMLRGKLEESRRALMRLQTESRRMSQVSNLTLDLSRPPTSKRASFVPLTGSPAARAAGHRRIASVSDSGVLSAPAFGGDEQWPSTPRSGDISQFSPSPMGGHSRRMSAMFGRGALQADLSPVSPESAELDALRKELERVKDQLEESKHELTEVQEAREASEICVKALRTYISDNHVGERAAHSPKLPSISTNAAFDDGSVSARKGSNASRWGFKLWGTDGNTTPTAAAAPVAAPAPSTTPPPLARKLGGLFSSRTTSVSSTASSLQPGPQRESMYNGSDTSSLADSTPEPLSPASSVPQTSVMVGDTSGESLVFVTSGAVEGKGVDAPDAGATVVAA